MPSDRQQSKQSRKLSHTTTDHDEIRRWAEERGARPVEVRGTGRGGDTGIIRLDFPGYTGEGTLRPISWDEWFEKFDENDLALVFQEKTARGQKSNFNKLVGRETAVAREKGERTSRRRGTTAVGTRAAKKATRRAPTAKSTRTERKPAAKSTRNSATKSTRTERRKPAAKSTRAGGKRAAKSTRGERRAPSRASARTTRAKKSTSTRRTKGSGAGTKKGSRSRTKK